MSPMLISAFREPAIPVLITPSTPNSSARICVQTAAFTLPIPLLTTTTSLPFKIPSQKFIRAFFTSRLISISAFSRATSTSIAPIIPIFFMVKILTFYFSYSFFCVSSYRPYLFLAVICLSLTIVNICFHQPPLIIINCCKYYKEKHYISVYQSGYSQFASLLACIVQKPLD